MRRRLLSLAAAAFVVVTPFVVQPAPAQATTCHSDIDPDVACAVIVWVVDGCISHKPNAC